MADGRQPENTAPQWASLGAQASSSPVGHEENGFSYRACQPGAASYARENGFNGDLPSGHAVTAEQVSARIVQEVTAEAVAVLKGEQELHPDTAVRLPSGRVLEPHYYCPQVGVLEPHCCQTALR
uniref:Uncharacterized protein n=1 Tax=Electrophorus electricus TaxID=8005 RepID=A0A4W4GQ56_ELEEL